MTIMGMLGVLHKLFWSGKLGVLDLIHQLKLVNMTKTVWGKLCPAGHCCAQFPICRNAWCPAQLLQYINTANWKSWSFQSMKLLNLSNSLFSCDISTCQDCWGKLICPAEHWCSWLPTLKATAVQHLLYAVHKWQMFICIHTSMSYKRPAHTWQLLLD